MVIGEEVTTRGGHLLALFVEVPIRPLRSLRSTIAAIHDQGGLAVPAHPLVPYPLCAQGWVLRRLLADPDPRFHPDGLETFNPTAAGRYWHGRVVRFAADHGLAALGNSDAHTTEQIGLFPPPSRPRNGGQRSCPLDPSRHHGTGDQLSSSAARSAIRRRHRDVGGRIRRDGTGRDHGCRSGPPRYRPAGDAVTRSRA